MKIIGEEMNKSQKWVVKIVLLSAIISVIIPAFNQYRTIVTKEMKVLNVPVITSIIRTGWDFIWKINRTSTRPTKSIDNYDPEEIIMPDGALRLDGNTILKYNKEKHAYEKLNSFDDIGFGVFIEYCKIRFDILILEWIGIIALGGFFFLLFNKSN